MMRTPMSWKRMAARSWAGRPGDRDLEFARQERELGMEGRPLAQQLAIRAGVLELVGCDAGEGVAGDVADAVAAGLDRVHLHARQFVENGRDVLETGPVVLDVLPRRDVSVPAIVGARDVCELAHLLAVEHAVGNGDAQHVRVQLHVETVLQPQRLELVLGDFAARCGVRPGRGTGGRAPRRCVGRTRRTGTWASLSIRRAARFRLRGRDGGRPRWAPWRGLLRARSAGR